MAVLAVFPLLLITEGLSVGQNFEDPRGEQPRMVGVPFSAFTGRQEIDSEVCPEGRAVVTDFLEAWKNEDYEKMFSLLDDPNETGYTLDEAKMDFRFMEYKPYRISSVKEAGEDFEFFLSYGDWRDGDKDLKKIIVSGRTFRIKLQKDRSFFQSSLGI